MPRKKTEQQIEFAKTVEYKQAANGIMKPTKYMPRTKPSKKRCDAGTAQQLKVVKIDAELYDYIISHKGDMTITQFTDELIKKAIEL